MAGVAAGKGARVVSFPEAFVSCYPRGLVFGTAIDARTHEGRAWFRRYWESSIDITGPAVDRISAIAARPAHARATVTGMAPA